MLPRKMIQAINQGDADALQDLLTVIEIKGVPLDQVPRAPVGNWDSDYWDSLALTRSQWMHDMQQNYQVPQKLMEAYLAGDQEAERDLNEFVKTIPDLTIPEGIWYARIFSREKLIPLNQYILELFFSETATKQQKKLIWEARDHIILDYWIVYESWETEYDEQTGEKENRLVSHSQHIRKTIAEIIEPHILTRLGHLVD